jgi:hypothetical protein
LALKERLVEQPMERGRAASEQRAPRLLQIGREPLSLSTEFRFVEASQLRLSLFVVIQHTHHPLCLRRNGNSGL